MGNLDALANELATDPLSRGYSGMTDQQAADSLNTVDRQLNIETLTGSEVMNALDKAEFLALSAADKQMVWDILHLGIINPFGIEADLFVDVFGGGSSTVTALQALRKSDISRATELGLGRVFPGTIAQARVI